MQSYIRFLNERPNYDACFNCQNNDFGCWANTLQVAGYSTNPDYAKLIVVLIKRFELHQLDDDPIVDEPKDDFVFFLNNSHGIDTRGKFWCFKEDIRDDEKCIYEYALNRNIVDILIKRFDAHGIKYVNVVPEMFDVSLKERCERVNAYKGEVKNGLLLTIDHNAAGANNENAPSIADNYDGIGNAAATGMESWCYAKTGETSKEFLTLLHKNIEKRFPNWTARGIKENRNFYTLKNSYCPAVILELGFFDNLKDARFLLSKEFQEGMTEAITETCTHFAGVEYVPLSDKNIADLPKSETETSEKPIKASKRKLYSM